MKVSSYFTFLPLLSCTADLPPADYTSSNGIAYHWHSSSWAPEQIERQEEYFLAGLFELERFQREDRKLVRGWLSGVQVWLIERPWQCGGGLTCAGTTQGLRVNVADMGCPYNSALSHELAHVIGGDPGHADKPLWTLANSGADSCP